MSFHIVINKPRIGTHGQYTITETECNKKGDIVKSKFIMYAKDNDEAKHMAQKYCDFHLIDSLIFANGKERQL